MAGEELRAAYMRGKQALGNAESLQAPELGWGNALRTAQHYIQKNMPRWAEDAGANVMKLMNVMGVSGEPSDLMAVAPLGMTAKGKKLIESLAHEFEGRIPSKSLSKLWEDIMEEARRGIAEGRFPEPSVKPVPGPYQIYPESQLPNDILKRMDEYEAAQKLKEAL